jgi:hypothetical protein
MVLTVPILLHHFVAALVDFLSPRARLAAENLLLRQQLVILRRTGRRPRFKPWERRLLSALAVRWSALQNAVLLVKPATPLRRHRMAWRWGGGGENPNDSPDVRQFYRSCDC